MSLLCFDIWYLIARKYLDNLQDLSSFALTCKEFYTVYQSMKIREIVENNRKKKKTMYFFNEETFQNEDPEERYFSIW
jgi:hypothetical protein